MNVRMFLLAGFMAMAPPALAQEPTFELKGVAFPQSTYLDDAALRGVTANYINRPITFPDVQQMLAELQLLYTQEGVLTAQVLLPPQDVADGILRLDLVEATIGTVNVDLTETAADFVTSRLSLAPGQQPDYDALAADIRIFELAYDIRPTLSFSAGQSFGRSDVVISADEPARWGWVASVDNYAAESLGRWQATVAGQVNSLTGQRDTLTFSAGFGEGITEGTIAYRRPIGPHGGAVFGSASLSQTQVVDGQFSVIDVINDKAEISLGYSRLGPVTADSYWRYTGALHYSRTSATLLGEALQETTLQEITGTVAYNRQYETATLNAAASLDLGSSDSGNAANTDGDFRVLSGSLSYGRAMSPDWVVEVALRGQYTNDPTLPSAKLFTLGSLTSLRGYPNGFLSGLYGVDLRVQVTRRPQSLGAGQPDFTWAPFAFADAGAVQPVAAGSDVITARTVGFGLRGTYDDTVSMIAMVGYPIDDIPSQSIPDGAKVYVGLDYNF